MKSVAPLESKRVLVAGAVNLDRYYSVPSLEKCRLLPWWPRAGERVLPAEERSALNELMVSSSDITQTLECGGGQAANFAVALAEIGAPVSLFSAVGNDPTGSRALEALGNVDLSFIHHSQRTTEAFIFVDDAGDRDILISPSDEPLPLSVSAISQIRWSHIHFTSMPLAKHVDLQVQIATQAASKSLDIGALYAEMGRPRLVNLLRGLDVLFATEQELEIFTDLPLPRAVDALFSDGVDLICCKRGSAGASTYSRAGISTHCEAAAVRSMDTTGAGDVFAAAFVAARLTGSTDDLALKVATVLASHSVTALGRQAYPNAESFSAVLSEVGYVPNVGVQLGQME